VCALGQIGSAAAEAVPAPIQVFADPEAGSAAEISAAVVLREIGPAAAEALPALIQVLTDPEAYNYVKSSAAYALGKIGPAAAEALPALIQVLIDPEADGVVKWNTAHALRKIAKKLNFADLEVKSIVVKALGNKDINYIVLLMIKCLSANSPLYFKLRGEEQFLHFYENKKLESLPVTNAAELMRLFEQQKEKLFGISSAPLAGMAELVAAERSRAIRRDQKDVSYATKDVKKGSFCFLM
jgi:hypothetical protein